VISLTDEERALGEGAAGPAMQFAMRLVVRAAEILGAGRLVPVTFAHIDACFYGGQVHVDFASYLLDNMAVFAVPAWTNNGVVSLADASLRPQEEDPETVSGARQLMKLYEALGCRPVWTCAPYQLPGRPRLGDHIVAGESNAVTFYNSVVGARTNKYGDFLDVACALVGRAPFAGLHTDSGRRASLLVDTTEIPPRFKQQDVFYHLLGYHVGRLAGRSIPLIAGLPPDASEDRLKALSAAVAASGGVELWHGEGLTPEAPAREVVFGGGPVHRISAADLAAARDELNSGRDGSIKMVALGTPHFSLSEFAELVPLLAGRKVHGSTVLYITTSRFIRDLAADRGWIAELEKAGAEIIVDTCTYFSPRVRRCRGRVMTNAAKWAYYAPGMLGVEVCFGSLRECVESAVRGEVWRDPLLWKELAP
jgi:hypothetical protein